MRTAGTRAPRKQTEHQAQADLFKFLRYFAPRVPAFGWVFAIPNGANIATGAERGKLTREGRTPGVWDILVPYRGYSTVGAPANVLWIEMKSATGRLTEEQESFRAALYDEAAFVVCRSWLEAARAIVNYLDVQDEAILAAIAVNEKGVPK